MSDFKISEEFLGGKRKDTISAHEAAMMTAVSWSLMSKDPSTQVGACILNTKNRVLSAGYNGTPIGWSDDEFPWAYKEGVENSKYTYVVHAEENAIANYKGSVEHFKDATIYVTLFPCSNCSKKIIQSGIKRVVYLFDDRKDTKDNIASKYMLNKAGVEFISFEELRKIDEVDISFDSMPNEYVKKLVRKL